MPPSQESPWEMPRVMWGPWNHTWGHCFISPGSANKEAGVRVTGPQGPSYT